MEFASTRDYYKFFIIGLVLAVICAVGISNTAYGLTHAKNCGYCVNNTNNQRLTIFNFENFDNPFLSGNATFVVIPNPYAFTTNATDYVDLTTHNNFVISDGGTLDMDPTNGIIDLYGVNEGTYVVKQIMAAPGSSPGADVASDHIASDTIGYAYSTQGFVNFTSTAYTRVEAPVMSDVMFEKMKTEFGAKVGGKLMTDASFIPPAFLVNAAQKFTQAPPDEVVFSTKFAKGKTKEQMLEMFSNLGIPTYSNSQQSGASGQMVMPPIYVADTDAEHGMYMMPPPFDKINPGDNIIMRFDEIDQKNSLGPMLKAIQFPFADTVNGENVKISTFTDTSIPAGKPAIPSGFVGMYLEVVSNDGIDLSKTDSYSTDPTISFNLDKVSSTCPLNVNLYLNHGSDWHAVSSNISPSSTTTHQCSYDVTVDHFSDYLVTTGSTVVDHGSHTSSSESHSSHAASSSHQHASNAESGLMHDEPQEHPHEHAIMEITKTLKIYEIQYNMETGFAQIIIGTTGSPDDIEVQAHGRTSGLLMAKPTKINPFKLLNNQSPNGMNKYVYEIMLNPTETYFRVSVDDAQYQLTQSVAIDGIRGKIVPWYANMYEQNSDTLQSEPNSQGADSTPPAEYSIKFDGGIKTVSYNDVQFQIKYEMAGAITGIQVDESAKSVTFLLSEVSEGRATIQVPRSLVDATGDNFVVLVTASPQQEIPYQIVSSTSDHYTLEMELPEGASSLTIMGSAVVPEFGLMTPLILSLAIIPIVLARKRFNQL